MSIFEHFHKQRTLDGFLTFYQHNTEQPSNPRALRYLEEIESIKCEARRHPSQWDDVYTEIAQLFYALTFSEQTKFSGAADLIWALHLYFNFPVRTICSYVKTICCNDGEQRITHCSSLEHACAVGIINFGLPTYTTKLTHNIGENTPTQLSVAERTIISYQASSTPGYDQDIRAYLETPA